MAYNNKISDTTRLTPFFTNYRKNINTFLQLRDGPNTEKALVKVEELKNLYIDIQRSIKSSNKKLREHINKKRKNIPQLKEGDKVYLLIKNMRTVRLSKKLDHVKVGLFLIKRVKGPVNYKLELLPDAKVYPVFHVSLLELVDPNIPL